MALDKYKLKLKKNKGRTDENLPGYSLSYKTNALNPNPAGYAILSALAGNHDVVIELNTDMFRNMSGIGEDAAAKFLKDAISRHLAHSCKKVRSEQMQTFFGFPTGSKRKKEAQRIAAYIPNVVWREESFQSVLPVCGAVYYFADEPMDAEAIVNDIWNMAEEEKASRFRMIVFNMAEFGQMGITTRSVGEEGLEGLLGL